MTRAGGTLLGVLATVAVVPACGDELTQIMLVLDTELAVPAEATTAVISVTGPSGRTREATAELATTRPATLALVPGSGEASGELTVRVELQRAGVGVADRIATTSFVAGRVKELGLCVERGCDSDCAALEVPGSSLPDWGGSVRASPCSAGADAGMPDGGEPPADDLGQALVLRQLDGRGIFLNRLRIRPDARLESISAVLDATFEPLEFTDDRDAALSPDGRTMVASIARGSCVGWGCVFVGPADDPASLRPILFEPAPDHLLHVQQPAVADDAALLVYPGEGAAAGHQMDLWITHRVDDVWQAPIAITTSSTWPFNKTPRLSADQTRVLFSCSYEIYAYDSICEVGVDGSGFRVLLMPDQAPPPFVPDRGLSLDSPRYAPDGSIVFSTAWSGRNQLWRLREGALPERWSPPTIDHLTQPCVLPGGHVVAVRAESGAAPGPTLAVFEPDGSLAYELPTDWEEGQLTWLTGCGR